MTRRSLLALPLAALALPDMMVIPFKQGPRLRFGHGVGSFFVHLEDSFWRVTHRRTGLYSGWSFSSAAQGVEFAKRIEPLSDWASIAAPIRAGDPRRDLRETLDRIAEEIDS